MTSTHETSQIGGGRGRRHRRIAAIDPAAWLKKRVHHLDMRRNNRKLTVLALVCFSFFFLWLSLKVFAQTDLWPLLAAPILVSAWFFYEAGVLATVAVTGLLLTQTSFEKSEPVTTAVFTFAAIGLGISWALRRQRRVHRQILRWSLTDTLTGLYNYGYFEEALDREMHRAHRYGGEITLIMFDIDHFKMFNDHFGHQTGNEALRMVADVIRGQKRESDIAARFGGEEFVLLLPGGEAGGLEIAARLSQAIASTPVPVGGGATAAITVSAGVASYPRGAVSKQELLDRVDQLLYQSKRNGRNRVSSAPSWRRLAV
ncbi:MAG: GGDEF domain-containing protein [Thermoleophilia bacterium]|nr:GGDEF domain-containing protein [Thermoleophilia bacterium]